MLRRTTRNKTRNEENADQIRQRKKDSATAQQNETALLRDKDVNKHRSVYLDAEKSKGDDKAFNSTSTNNTQKSKIKVFREETGSPPPTTPKSTPGTPTVPAVKSQTSSKSVTPAKRTLRAEEEHSLSAKRFESHSPGEEDETEDENGLKETSPEKKSTLDTRKDNPEETDVLDEISLPSEVEYANPQEEELPSEPRVTVDLSGFSGALPNIGAYEIKALDPYELNFDDDDDVERIIQGRHAGDDDENDEVFVLPTEPFSPSLEPKDDGPLEIPFSDYLFDVNETKDEAGVPSPVATSH
ncbi:hypothetical protein BX666DRAFT_42989 [Dichotomocladium elegans]|nr:hypothetical protein BX666DRAFT_42989 [Dichotomocladium elegans]